MLSLLKHHWKTTAAFIVALAILAYLGKGLTNARVEDVTITGVHDVSATSLTLDGKLAVTNPSLLSLPVKHVNYVITLNRTGSTISTGNVPSFTLHKQTTTTTNFTHALTWKPTGMIATEMVTQDTVYLDLDGNVTVSILGLTTYNVPFQKQFDLKQYLQEQLRHRTTTVSETFQEGVNEVGDTDTTVEDVTDETTTRDTEAQNESIDVVDTPNTNMIG